MRRTPLLALLAVFTLVLVGVGAAATPEASFSTRGPETTPNGTAAFTIDITETDRATLHVGSERDGYLLNATIVDANGDGTVAVEFDASNAGTSDTTLSATDGDSVTVNNETELQAPRLEPAAYRLALFVEGNKSDVDRMLVRQAHTAEQTTETSNGATTTKSASEGTTTERATGMADDPSSNGTVPGFGMLGALAAAAAAALVAVRR
ncbi:DUF7827 domain-containing protein [Halobacterium jilantaiense]|uniref:DUF7827 domain-containing protein n=1 Tax=Halobacterium jilantaiense TaxID=355548 RepID=A0A1I0N1J5_9EURY|nr:hypothetical protein [Halobacterium jilantaiense]SEV94904.1 hypothetical protein SAMN04487945_0538 [Halobacterium jilantaiense]